MRKVAFNMLIQVELKEKIEAAARDLNIDRASLVRMVLTAWLRNREKK